MKNIKFLLLTSLIFALLLGACATPVETPDVEAELRATLIALNVEQTVQLQQIETLQSQLAQPTATCPVCATEAPTATPGQPTDTPTPVPTTVPTGSISGKLGFPSSFIPPLRIVAINTVTGHYWWQNTVENQSSYRFTDLPVAKYYVLAYQIQEPSRTFYAAYSNFVTCGLSASCTNHNLISVEVKAGQEATNIDPVDWYATDPEALGWPLDPTINWN